MRLLIEAAIASVALGLAALGVAAVNGKILHSAGHECVLSYSDTMGSQHDYVVAQGVEDCSTISAPLASFGYWSDLTPALFSNITEDGGAPHADLDCEVTSNGVTVSVYGVPESDDSVPVVAGQVCQSYEEGGWTPDAVTQ